MVEIVCRQWTNPFEVLGYGNEDVLALIQDAYRERAKEGISFATLNYTLSDFLSERTNNDFWFLAFDKNNKSLIGTARLTIEDNKGEVCNFAVSPKCQGRRIGAFLLQEINNYACEHKLNYIQSYTAMKAKSSVKCHLNNRYQITGIDVGLHRHYSSYSFRNYLSNQLTLKRIILIKLQYTIDYIKYKLFKETNGENTYLGCLYLNFKNKKKCL